VERLVRAESGKAGKLKFFLSICKFSLAFDGECVQSKYRRAELLPDHNENGDLTTP